MTTLEMVCLQDALAYSSSSFAHCTRLREFQTVGIGPRYCALLVQYRRHEPQTLVASILHDSVSLARLTAFRDLARALHGAIGSTCQLNHHYIIAGGDLLRTRLK